MSRKRTAEQLARRGIHSWKRVARHAVWQMHGSWECRNCGVSFQYRDTMGARRPTPERLERNGINPDCGLYVAQGVMES